MHTLRSVARHLANHGSLELATADMSPTLRELIDHGKLSKRIWEQLHGQRKPIKSVNLRPIAGGYTVSVTR